MPSVLLREAFSLECVLNTAVGLNSRHTADGNILLEFSRVNQYLVAVCFLGAIQCGCDLITVPEQFLKAFPL